MDRVVPSAHGGTINLICVEVYIIFSTAPSNLVVGLSFLKNARVVMY